jgi:hypothetical protein
MRTFNPELVDAIAKAINTRVRAGARVVFALRTP